MLAVEAMISLSRIFKSVRQQAETQVKTINQYEIPHREISTQIITANEPEAMPVVDQLVQDAEDTARKILEQAKNEALELKQNAKKEIEQWWDEKRVEIEQHAEFLSKQGYEEGFNKGFQHGVDEGKTQQGEILQQAKQTLEEAYRVAEQIIQESEPTLIELAISIAQKILNKELETDPNSIKNITQEALKNVNEFESIVLNVNPNYFAYLQGAKDELLLELNGQVKLHIYPDASIQDAGVMIKTNNGTLDARIDTQLEEIKQILLDVLNRKGS